MNEGKATARVSELETALGRLREILGVPEDHMGRVDAMIQRFEFSYELTWKALKAALEVYGLVTASPRDAWKKAYAAGWIESDRIWLDMLDDRNLTSHTYNESLAEDIAARIPSYLPAMEQLCGTLRQVLEEASRDDA